MRTAMKMTFKRGAKSAAGFTMLEVLISIVVIAFGLLGIAGLQAFALQNNQSAGQRITTTLLANDMVERVFSSNIANRPLYNQPLIGQYGTPDPNSPCLSGGCSPAELVANDLAEWEASLNSTTNPGGGLPGGEGIICIDASPDDGVSAASPSCDFAANAPYVVKIWWLDDRSVTATAAKQRFTWSFNP